jgi:hypothetical protein
MSAVYCNQCGSPNAAEAVFCSKCGRGISAAGGAPLAAGAAPMPFAPAASPAQNAPHTPTSAVSKVVLIGGLMALVVVGVCVVVVLMLSRGGASTPSQADQATTGAAPQPGTAATSPAGPQVDEAATLAAAQLTQQAAARTAQAKASLRTNPSKYLDASDVGVHDKGIVNSYRELTSLTVLNRSAFAVDSVQGEVDWFDSGGSKIGSTTFTLAGSIPASATVVFSKAQKNLVSGTLQGKATTERVRFTAVNLVETP